MTQTGKVYGEALYELAKEESLEKEFLSQLNVLAEAFRAAPEYLALLSEPSVAKDERCRLLDEAFRGKLHDYCLNFLKLLCEKGYIRRFDDCEKAFRRRFNEDNGVLEVRAVTAVELTAQLRRRLTEKLEATTGKTIELHCRVDPSCIAGVRLEMDGQQLDGTVRRRLDTIQKALQQATV